MKIGAGEGNRTLVISLEGFSSTIELHPPALRLAIRIDFLPHCNSCNVIAGGGGWIRTIVGVSQQIYSLPPLATRAPLRSEWQIMRAAGAFVKSPHCAHHRSRQKSNTFAFFLPPGHVLQSIPITAGKKRIVPENDTLVKPRPREAATRRSRKEAPSPRAPPYEPKEYAA